MIHKKKLLLVIIFIIFSNIQSIAQDKYFVRFKDKSNNPYSIQNPSEFLSERAINRRTKQGITISETDLPVVPNYIQQVAGTGATINYSLKWFNGTVVTITNSSQLTSIQNLTFVSSTEKIYDWDAKGSKLTVDFEEMNFSPKKSKSIQDLNYGNSSTQIEMMNGHLLHNDGYMGEGIQIAVLDAGFLNVDTHSAFDSLRIRNRILGTKDFVNPYSNIYQEHSHGMMVLSTMGGYVEGQLIGTAPRAKYWLIRTENANLEQIIEEYNWAAGAEFADSVGVDIINTSLGYTTFDVTSQSHPYNNLNGSTTPITLAANFAASTGIAVVVSAGNDGDSQWYYISAPADSPNVLTVGAVDSERTKASFSSFGPSADGRIKPDVCAMGEAAVVANPSGTFGVANGTSFSSPIMAGMLACLWQAKPHLNVSELIQLVKANSSLFQTPNNGLGYGIPNFATAAEVGTSVYEANKIVLFPNPFSNKINIKLPEYHSEHIEYTIYSILGDEVLKEKKHITGNTFEIDIPTQLSKGNYLIRVKSSTDTYFTIGVKN